MKEEKDYISLEDLDSLKMAYDKAIEEELDIFIFKEHELLTQYAKYLIQYLELLKTNK
jgi:hypothetical protein